MDKDAIVAKVREAKEKTPKRNFKQSVEVSINFKGINMEDTANKLNASVVLPKGRGRDVEIGVFADGDMAMKAKNTSKHVLDKNTLLEYASSKRRMRVFADQCYGFIAQADLMSIIGKNWGVVLAPRGKMPQPIPVNADIEAAVRRLKNTVRVRSKKNPTINVPVGTEDMNDEDLAENVLAVLSVIERQIHKDNIASVYFKACMGPAVKLW